MPESCKYCGREFSVKSNLTRHVRFVHDVHKERVDIQPGGFQEYQFKCLEGCAISFKYNRELRKHLQDTHATEISEIHLEFPNKEEFDRWRQYEETENCVQYVNQTASKKSSRGGETIYYECSRSGKSAILRDEERKRRIRKNGTAKLNRGCTSQIIANKSFGGMFSVTYFKKHYGHDLSLEHLKLTKQERGSLASKLSLGIPIQQILHSVKKSEGPALKRIDLLGIKDLSNIRKSFKVDYRNGKLTNEDAVDVNLFISECAQQENNPILFSNINDLNTDSDLCFIIMTKYQSEQLKNYGGDVIIINTLHLSSCDFDLITLIVINHEGRCFPAVCSLTNIIDENFFKLFLHKIRDVSGTINTKILLTNCDELYYNTWTEVMGPPEKHFYTFEHLNLDWKLNLNRIISTEIDVSKEKRKWACDTLQTLQTIEDHDDFVESFECALKVFRTDPDFKDFCKYFESLYKNPLKWAKIYRTDLKLPQFNIITDILKQYFSQEHCYRLDKIFHSLVRFIRDETVNSVMEDQSNHTIFISENNARHLMLDDKQFTALQPFEETFSVTELDSGKKYLIQQHLENVCCNLTCSLCHICVHCFSCTCVDYFLSNSICSHIHYIWLTYFQSIVLDEHSGGNCEEEIIIQVDMDDQNQLQLRTEIADQMLVLKQNVGNIHNTEKLQFVVDSLNQLCEFTKPHPHGMTEETTELVLEDHSYVTSN